MVKNDVIITNDYESTFNSNSTVKILVKTEKFADAINLFCGTMLIAKDQELTVGKETYNKIIKNFEHE